jgi:F-type H+-transporting ATPase subunit alpha
MSMTDGHIYFDSNLFSEGRRPAVNPFISVTRVGKQTQSASKRSINRELLSFLTLYEKMRKFSHFGAEVTDSIKVTTETGNKLLIFFDQDPNAIIPSSVQVILLTLIWGGNIQDVNLKTLGQHRDKISEHYLNNLNYKKYIDDMINASSSFNDLILKVKSNLKYVYPFAR